MKHCTVLSHLAFEDLGLLEPILYDRGFKVRVIDVPSQGAPTESLWFDADLWVVLGGPIGVCDTDDYPFLTNELAGVGARLTRDRPVLGICLGAQIMAASLGGKVGPNPKGKEIGWSSLTLNDAGLKGPLRHLKNHHVLHWHGDKIDPPGGAQVLASTEITPCQAFAWGERALGLQFHPEPTAAGLERWLVGNTAELNAAKIDIGRLRADNQAYAPLLPQALQNTALEWLRQAGL